MLDSISMYIYTRHYHYKYLQLNDKSLRTVCTCLSSLQIKVEYFSDCYHGVHVHITTKLIKFRMRSSVLFNTRTLAIPDGKPRDFGHPL